MSYSAERRALLAADSQSEDEESSDSFDSFSSRSLTYSYRANVSRVRFKRKCVFFKTFLFVYCTLFCGNFAINRYNDSMKELEATECSDVLADCDSVPFNETLVPPYYDYLQMFTVTPRYDISMCLIPKVMSTIGTAAFCYLSDPVAFVRVNRTISTERYKQRFCKENDIMSVKFTNRLLSENAENIIIVRDPVDRFISGFTEKCVNSIESNYCHDCGTDMICFLQKEYRRLKRISMLFPVYSMADTHFAPQTWYCDMKNALRGSTLIKYSNSGRERTRMIYDFLNVFRRKKVPEKNIDEVRKELSKGRSHHSTAGSNTRRKYEKLIRKNSAIRRAIVRLYYYDFVIFGYDIPTFQ